LGQGCTPAEAAAQAGYQDYSTFSRAYKKQFGHGPSADTKGKQHDLQITTQEF
jgi:AraC-like DNA-binding protein